MPMLVSKEYQRTQLKYWLSQSQQTGKIKRGLCGSINTNLIRELRTVVQKNRTNYSIICIGEKGTQALARPFPDLLKESINEIATPFNFYAD